MQMLAKSIVTVLLAGLLALGGFLASWEVFLTFVEGRSFFGTSGLFLSQLPTLLVRLVLGALAGGVLTILTYRGRPLVWALLMSALASLATIQMTTTIYMHSPSVAETIIHSAGPYMYIPGAILGALLSSSAIRLARGPSSFRAARSTGRSEATPLN